MRTITTQKQLRNAFWQTDALPCQRIRGKKQNDYPCDLRMAWVDFIDNLSRDSTISVSLADRATL